MKLICSDCHEVMLDAGKVFILTEKDRALGNCYLCPMCNNRVMTIDPTAAVHDNAEGLPLYKL